MDICTYRSRFSVNHGFFDQPIKNFLLANEIMYKWLSNRFLDYLYIVFKNVSTLDFSAIFVPAVYINFRNGQ